MRIRSGSEARHTAALMVSASVLTTLGSIPPFLLGVQAVRIRADLDVDLALFGAAVSAFFASAALCSMIGGGLVDRLGRRRGTALAGTLVAAGGGSVAGLVDGPRSLVAAMVLLGAGNAACQLTANLSVARALPPHRRGLGFGIKQSAIPLAIMVVGLAAPVAARVGWRATFATTACLGLVALSYAALRPVARMPPGGPSVAPGAEEDLPPLRPLLLCGLAITLASAAANSLGAFVASWGFEVGLTPSQAGLLMAAGSFGSIVVRVVSGHRADRRGGGNLPVVAWQMYAGAACLAALAVPQIWVVVTFGLLAFAVGWAWPGLLLFAVARIGRDRPAGASGVIQAGAFAGGALGPAGFGVLVGLVGFPVAWLVAASLMLGGGTLVLWARRMFVADLAGRPPRVPLTTGRQPQAPRSGPGRGDADDSPSHGGPPAEES